MRQALEGVEVRLDNVQPETGGATIPRSNMRSRPTRGPLPGRAGPWGRPRSGSTSRATAARAGLDITRRRTTSTADDEAARVRSRWTSPARSGPKATWAPDRARGRRGDRFLWRFGNIDDKNQMRFRSCRRAGTCCGAAEPGRTTRRPGRSRGSEGRRGGGGHAEGEVSLSRTSPSTPPSSGHRRASPAFCRAS